MKSENKITSHFFIKRINNGDEEAFKILFKLYYNKLFYIIQSYISSKEDSEEILQEIFITIWKKRKNITSNINGYILTTTKNACIDYLRSKKRKLSTTSNYSQIESLINHKALTSPETSKIIEQELNNKINQAISSLPNKCKVVFIKSRVNGLKNKEISEELNISIKTVENHITKALKHMKFHLREFLSIF